MTPMSTNPYQIWIEAQGEKLLIPVNPPKVEIKVSGNNQSVTLAELGETSILQSPKAETLSFSSFFPAKPLPFAQYAASLDNLSDFNSDGTVNVRDLAARARAQGTNFVTTDTISENRAKVLPHYCISFISDIFKRKIPVRVYITMCDFIHFMSVENFTYSQKGGDVGSYDYSISFKEYQDIKVRQVTVQNGKAVVPKKTAARVSTVTKPATYIVKAGDSIYDLAKKYYGDTSAYRKIYDANKRFIGSNPNRIKPGTVLILP